ncbi:MAG: hypothetical protein ACR2MW_03750 [Chthoniobacterales bacterium]
MRLPRLLVLALSIFCSGCAVHGVVVNKTHQPSPASSGAADGSYRIDLRGPDKVVHSQLVSPAVFAAYQIGDDFDASLSLAAMSRRNLTKREQKKAAALLAQLSEERSRQASRQMLSETAAHITLRPEMLAETEAF